ncbi:MAG TPA: alpha/beta hydrolase, partial [Steroidobacteraceae bacterium]|nr:alpha/beta hydrolase [Steroidobacteraceae bacterium]
MLILRKLLARAGILTLAAASAACTSISFLVANVPAAFGPYHRTTDIAYGSDKRQKLDVYVPADAAGADAREATGSLVQAASSGAPGEAADARRSLRPVVIFWYGGSWQSGSKSSYRFVGAALAERGFIAVLPDYRLYPKVRFPEFVDDAAKAVAWVQQHAQEFGGDPRRIVLMGHSAGAHTAAFLALKPDFLVKAGANPQWIAGLVGLAGPYAIAPNTRALRRIFGRPYVAADYQPVRFVTPAAPPAFLAHGLDDHVVSVHQTEALRDALRRNDVRVDTELYPDRGHADMVAAFSVPARHRAPVL